MPRPTRQNHQRRKGPDPDLIIEPEPVPTEKREESRFSKKNFYSSIDPDSESDEGDESSEHGDSNEVEIEIDDEEVNTQQEPKSAQNGNATETKKRSPNETSPQKSKKRNFELNKIKSSNGFVTSPQKLSLCGRAKRTSKPRDKFVPNFDPTYKRKQVTMSAFQSNEDAASMDPDEVVFDQLMSCMEQNLQSEKGQLNDNDMHEIHNNLLDLDSPDPKSQAAIDKMPEAKRKLYNDATKKEYEGMKKKNVMENVRMTDMPPGSKLYICIVNWVTKFVLGTYSKTKCRICFGIFTSNPLPTALHLLLTFAVY